MAKKLKIAITTICSLLIRSISCNQVDSLKMLDSQLSFLSTTQKPSAKIKKIRTKGKRSDFFQKMMGFDEKKYLIDPYLNNNKAYNQMFLEHNLLYRTTIKGKPQFIIHSLNGAKYQAGYFTMPTLITLKEQAAKLKKPRNGKFNIVIGTNTELNSSYRNTVDVGALQADPNNRDAVFQVASNFSALEPTGITHYPELGISNYIFDHTQGPFASISAAPGLFYRMYGIFYNSDKKPNEWRQTTQHQVELLSGGVTYPQLKNIFPVTNGYIDYKNNPQSLKEKLTQKDQEEIRIGYHRDIQVTYGFTVGNEHYDVDDKDQIINQVFTAAVDLGSLNSGYKNNPVVIQRAQALLNAAYGGTLLAAIANKKKKVFLTLIGGGVFGNRISWIAESISKNEELIKDYGLNVTLIIYSYENLKNQNEKNDMATFKILMTNLLNSTKGSLIINGNLEDYSSIKKLS